MRSKNAHRRSVKKTAGERRRSDSPKASSTTFVEATESGGAALELQLRPAESTDYPFALDLYLHGSKKHLIEIGRWDERRVVSRFRRGFKPEQSRIICVNGADVGWMQVAEFLESFHLRQIHLVDRYRGHGIGTRLIQEQLKLANDLGKDVTLDVIHGNPAKSLYIRLGFTITGQDADKLHLIWRPRAVRVVE
jgi:GNAT superfamily N-acetyltransferase